MHLAFFKDSLLVGCLVVTFTGLDSGLALAAHVRLTLDMTQAAAEQPTPMTRSDIVEDDPPQNDTGGGS